jgi:hypothetical protein
MNRKILLLNVCLLALLALLGWWLRGRWLDARTKETAVLSKAARRTELLPPPSPVLPAPANAAEYPEVVTKTLFSKDRDPNVAPPAPPPPPPPKPEDPIPPRPVYHGQMQLGDPVAFLSIDNKAQKSYQAGDEVGPFKLVAFDRDQMKFEWHGKTLEYKLSDLKPSKDAIPQQQAAAADPAPPPPPPAKPVTAADSNPSLGEQMGQFRACAAGDASPPGTVIDGFKKVISGTMMGQTCYWEPVK